MFHSAAIVPEADHSAEEALNDLAHVGKEVQVCHRARVARARGNDLAVVREKADDLRREQKAHRAKHGDQRGLHAHADAVEAPHAHPVAVAEVLRQTDDHRRADAL